MFDLACLCPGGGIGRRAALRSLFFNRSGSSSLLGRTKIGTFQKCFSIVETSNHMVFVLFQALMSKVCRVLSGAGG